MQYNSYHTYKKVFRYTFAVTVCQIYKLKNSSTITSCPQFERIRVSEIKSSTERINGIPNNILWFTIKENPAESVAKSRKNDHSHDKEYKKELLCVVTKRKIYIWQKVILSISCFLTIRRKEFLKNCCVRNIS